MLPITTEMLARLGNVLHWLGCILSLILIGLAILVTFNGGTDKWVLAAMASIAALVVFGFGRASKYVLAGK